MRPLTDAWRSATSRLIIIYGALFAIWCVVLLGIVQWETSRYLSGVIDQMLASRVHYLEGTAPRDMTPGSRIVSTSARTAGDSP